MKRTTKYVAFDVHQAPTEGGQEKQHPASQTPRLSHPGEACYEPEPSMLHFKLDIKDEYPECLFCLTHQTHSRFRLSS